MNHIVQVYWLEMSRYSAIIILYNPNSTGPSKQLASKLRHELIAQDPALDLSIKATKYSGHGELLAYKYSKASKHPLIISSSGDGGYHDIVNGILKANAEGADAIAGLLPAGNANDHFNALHQSDMVRAIVSQHEQTIDLLHLQYETSHSSYDSYAHSYIGLGLTPHAGQAFNQQQLTRWKELWIVTKVLFSFRAVRLNIRGSLRTYDSIIFSNIGTMSKVLHLSDIASPTDGKFEITTFHRQTKRRLFATLLRASTKGLHGTRQADHYTFATTRPTLVQLDGEIITIPRMTTVHITIVSQILHCIV